MNLKVSYIYQRWKDKYIQKNKKQVNSLLVYSFLLFCLLVNSLFVFGQKSEPKGINSIIQVLQKELEKAGFSSIEVKADGEFEGRGFQLDLLNENELAKLRLKEAPFDAFYLKATNSNVYIASSSTEGLQNGVFWYLQQLGYRYYFPHEVWHVVPKLKTVYKPVEKISIPSFTYRRIWYAYGTDSKKADADYNLWSKANLQGGEAVNTGHSYEAIVNRNRAVFKEHPEYFAGQVDKGKIPANPKFEVSNEGLVQLCIQDAFNQIEASIRKTGMAPSMISMDPSDGGGFSTSPASLKIGGPSEQAFYLANRVASAVRQKYPFVKIGMYAYNLHAAPPKFAVELNIVVLVATAMNKSLYRTDELVELWRKKGVSVGLRDYYGVMEWDWDMPGSVAGGKLKNVQKLKSYYQAGIRYFSAETNIGWISRGLGHYIAAQLLWDAHADMEALKKDFFTQLFGKAANIISQLYDSWEKYNQPVPHEGDLLEWNKLVAKASQTEPDKAVQLRLDQIKQYLHYVYFFKKWKKENTDESLLALMTYAYRVQDDGIMASYPLFRRLTKGMLKNKPGMRFYDKDAIWKKNESKVTKTETEHNFQQAIKTLNPSDKIEVPVFPHFFFASEGKEKNIGGQATSAKVQLRGPHTILFLLHDTTNAAINFSVGLIKSGNFKKLRVQIFPYKADLTTDKAERVLQAYLEPKQYHSLSLASLKPGAYIAVLDDSKSGFKMTFSGAVTYGIVAHNEKKTWTISRNNLTFLVPKGTKEFTLQTNGVLTLKSPSGRKIDLQKRSSEPRTIIVEKGEEGIWKMQQQSGTFYLQGILPLVSADEKFLLKAQ
jgi:hypothetical protein